MLMKDIACNFSKGDYHSWIIETFAIGENCPGTPTFISWAYFSPGQRISVVCILNQI